MIFELDERLEREIREHRLAFTCERCVQFDPDSEACSAGYPNEEHRRARVERARLVVFCKEFEIA